MAIVKVAINGYGTIGKRVADAVDAQDDMEVVGVTKTGPSFGCEMAVRKNFDIYCTSDDPEMIRTFDNSPFDCKGGLQDLLAIDVVIDCSPGKMGKENLEKYVEAGIKSIFQGGENTHSQVFHIHHAQITRRILVQNLPELYLKYYGTFQDTSPALRALWLIES